MSVQLAMMDTAHRNGELVADPATQRTGLGKTQMMWVGRAAATHQTWLQRDEPAVVLVAEPNGFSGDAATPTDGFAGNESNFTVRTRLSRQGLW
jgi:hypothetical protein